MYLPCLYKSEAHTHRIRYAITTIKRGYVVNEGAFRVCFEMEDEAAVIRAILIRSLRNSTLRAALERSHLINLTSWLRRFPDIAEAYAKAHEHLVGNE